MIIPLPEFKQFEAALRALNDIEPNISNRTIIKQWDRLLPVFKKTSWNEAKSLLSSEFRRNSHRIKHTS